ncbi:Uncharacterized protein HZ326_12601 [Fusarium oxysporum f. sp. albedinis]|nr:Uncharacterized protein HZ326_12601 [Fusarium oxysporum f. sp. albedinis]
MSISDQLRLMPRVGMPRVFVRKRGLPRKIGLFESYSHESCNCIIMVKVHIPSTLCSLFWYCDCESLTYVDIPTPSVPFGHLIKAPLRFSEDSINMCLTARFKHNLERLRPMRNSFLESLRIRYNFLPRRWIDGKLYIKCPEDLGNSSPLHSLCEVHTGADTTTCTIAVVVSVVEVGTACIVTCQAWVVDVATWVEPFRRTRYSSDLGLPHTVTKDDYYDGMLIPKGSTIFVGVWAMHHDKDYYGSHDTFDPDRYLSHTKLANEYAVGPDYEKRDKSIPQKYHMEL